MSSLFASSNLKESSSPHPSSSSLFTSPELEGACAAGDEERAGSDERHLVGMERE